MKDSDLKSKLDALKVPERDQEYWETFSQRVVTRLHSAPEAPSRGLELMPRFGRGFAMALACVAAGFCLWQSRLPRTVSCALLKDERELRATLVQFPGHLSAIIQDEHGLHRLIEDPQ